MPGYYKMSHKLWLVAFICKASIRSKVSTDSNITSILPHGPFSKSIRRYEAGFKCYNINIFINYETFETQLKSMAELDLFVLSNEDMLKNTFENLSKRGRFGRSRMARTPHVRKRSVFQVNSKFSPNGPSMDLNFWGPETGSIDEYFTRRSFTDRSVNNFWSYSGEKFNELK